MTDNTFPADEIEHLDGISTTQLAGSFALRAGTGPSLVLFVHGNCSSSTFWEETMLSLPAEFSAFAVDLRGYGSSPALPVDATRGLRDFADDVFAAAEAALEVLRGEGATDNPKFHLVGHSLGGGVALQCLIDHGSSLLSVSVVDPVPPRGFGGCSGTAVDEQQPWVEDCAGTGAGGANPSFVAKLKAKDRSGDAQDCPLTVMRAFYGKSPFSHPREEQLLIALLSTHVSDDNYPGNALQSQHWPGSAPGTRGVLNALSPRYCDLRGVVSAPHRPPLLWVRGEADAIVCDESLFDLGTLGKLGVLPGYPGADSHPPQRMVAQTAAVFAAYAEAGSPVTTVVIEDAGHTPFLEKPDEFNAALHPFLAKWAAEH